MCPIYLLAKQSRLPFSPGVISSTKPFETIHYGIWGCYRHPFISGAYYFLTVVDDYTRFTWIFLIRHKNETQSLLKCFFSYVHTQFDSYIKIFRSINGGEFLSLRSFFQDIGIIFSTFLHLHAPTKWCCGTQTSSHLKGSQSFKISCSPSRPILGRMCTYYSRHHQLTPFFHPFFQNSFRTSLLKTTLFFPY